MSYKDEPFGETDYPDYPLYHEPRKQWCDGCLLVITQNESGLCDECEQQGGTNAA